MDQESLKQLLKSIINETESKQITSIKDMIQLLAIEMENA